MKSQIGTNVSYLAYLEDPPYKECLTLFFFFLTLIYKAWYIFLKLSLMF